MFVYSYNYVYYYIYIYIILYIIYYYIIYIIQDESTKCVTGGDPAATETQRRQSCSSFSTQAPDVGPFLKQFTSFSYQIASGMVSLVLQVMEHVLMITATVQLMKHAM